MRAIGLSSITLATVALTATDVRSANNNWCATYTRPANENCTFATFEQCHAQVWGTWRMVSAQSVPQYGVRDRLELVQATATVARRPLAQPRGVAPASSCLDGAASLSRDARRPISDVTRILGHVLNF